MEQQNRAMEGFKNSLVNGMHAFREVFDEEGSATYTADQTIDINELKEEVRELDEKANEILQTIEQTNKDESR